MQGDLLHPIKTPVDLVVANLPYITDSEMTRLSRDILEFEPRQALFGGPDGLEHIKRLLTQAKEKVNPDGTILLEIGQEQAEAITESAKKIFPQAAIEVLPDLSGADRVFILRPEG